MDLRQKNIVILVSENLNNFFLCEKYEEFAGGDFMGSGHFQYFFKPIFHFSSQNYEIGKN